MSREKYKQAPVWAVASFMAGLYAIIGRADMAEGHIVTIVEQAAMAVSFSWRA